MEKQDGQNMPCWYYEKTDLKKTPSFYDGINAETEARYRREGPRFIFDMGSKLGLHHDTIATGIVFFHRFYMFHSFKKFPRYITATCCLFLAGKVEETPKKCKDLVKVAKGLLNEAQFSQFGDDPREEVLTFEKVLLQTIKFDLTVEHPYKYLLQYAKGLKVLLKKYNFFPQDCVKNVLENMTYPSNYGLQLVIFNTRERSKIEKLVQMAWTFINDSLCTSLCLQWEPQIVAVAVMYLAGRLCKFEPQDWAYNRGRWWEQFIDDISIELLEDICHQVLDQYSHAKGSKTGGKGKRERPKTPGENDKTSEPQAKSSRSETQKQVQKPKSSQAQSTASQKPHSTRSSSSVPPPPGTKNPPSNQRRGSSNTEVVAMETVDTTDRGVIEQGKPSTTKPTPTLPITPVTTSNVPTPSKPPPNEQSSSYYNINQYQSFIGSSDSSSLGFMQQGTYGQFPANFPGLPVSGQVPPVRQTFSGPTPPTQAYPFPPVPGSFDTNFHRFPPTPEAAQNNFPPNFNTVGQVPTNLATVRITGRRDQQQSNVQWP